MRDPLISICIPTRNRAAWLAKYVTALMAQSHENWELVLGDHSDNARECIGALPRDERIIYHHEKLVGPPGAKALNPMLNYLFTIARGSIMMQSADDDLLLPDALAHIALALEPHLSSAAWAYGKCAFVMADGRNLDTGMGTEQTYLALLAHNDVPTPSAAWTRVMYQTIGPLDETVPYASDYEYWLRMAKVTPPIFINAILSYHTVHPDRITDKNRGEMMFDTLRIRERYKRLPA